MKRKYCILMFGLPLFLLACGNNNNTIKTEAPNQSSSANVTASAIFTAKCALCHDLQRDKIGPALAGATSRWGNDNVKLKSFIRNSQQVIGGGDAYASTLYQKWHSSVMPSFPDLTDEELNLLVDYIK
jgi:cytochrome c551/c552